MEERTQTFDEKLELLLEEAKKKKNVLENREILNFFKGEILDPEKLDRIYDFLDNHHVDVLRTEEEDDIDPELFLDEDSEEEEEAELEQLDLSVPEGVGVEDPVRMYLKEIGKIPRLPRTRKLSWQSAWSWATSRQKSAWRRQISVWWSALRKICGPWHAVSRSDPGRQSGTDQGCGEV